MKLSAVRPVGEPVTVFPPRAGFRWPDGYRAAWLNSGTSALAVAIRGVLGNQPEDRRHVVVPAYTCPDVLSAIIWAGGTPLVVDIQVDSPWINWAVADLVRSSSIAAVIAPHFLGIPHPLDLLIKWCAKSGAALIEDSAQLGPVSRAFSPSAELVVLSFGRGKPTPVGGGVLLYREELSDVVTDTLSHLPDARSSALAWRARILLQNAAYTRLGFAMVQAIPGFHVGETAFRRLDEAARLKGTGTRLAEAALASWIPSDVGVAVRLSEILRDTGCVNLPDTLDWNRDYPLLRFPVLAPDERTRNRLVSILDRGGASPFYRVPLPAIDGVPSLDAEGDLTNADAFARRLLTLPCHSGIGRGDLDRISRAFSGLE